MEQSATQLVVNRTFARRRMELRQLEPAASQEQLRKLEESKLKSLVKKESATIAKQISELRLLERTVDAEEAPEFFPFFLCRIISICMGSLCTCIS